MGGSTDFTKLVPGFDFLQGLMKNAGAGLPNIGQWIAPTLNPEELDKRIEELRTVQFWLEQNAKLLATTIQALEVQRMTLATLQTMNLPLADLRESLKIKLPASAAATEPQKKAPAARAPTRKADADKPAAQTRPDSRPAAPPAVDPMQWWGALTQQFTELAAKALRDTTGDAARNLAGAVVKQSIDSAGQAFTKAASVPVKAAARTAGAVAGAAGAAASAAAGAAGAAVKSARRRGG